MTSKEKVIHNRASTKKKMRELLEAKETSL